MSVWRGDASGGSYRRFEVPQQPSQTVLDVVTWISSRRMTPPSPTVCLPGWHVRICAMMVNDEPRWTCRTHVERVARDGELHIAPLRNLPVIKDLVTDMDPFFDKWVKAERPFVSQIRRDDTVAAVTPDDPTPGSRAPASNASTARSAMPPATRWPAIRIIWGRQRCNAPGRCIMIPATGAAMPSSTRCRNPAAATAAIRWEAAAITAQTTSTRWAPSPG